MNNVRESETSVERLAASFTTEEKVLLYKGYNAGLRGDPCEHPTRHAYVLGYNRACAVLSASREDADRRRHSRAKASALSHPTTTDKSRRSMPRTRA